MPYFFWVTVLLGCLAGYAALSGQASRLTEIERKLNLALEKLGVDPDAAARPSELVMKLARDSSRRIDALRQYRKESGAGLKEAVKVIDALPAGGKTGSCRGGMPE